MQFIMAWKTQKKQNFFYDDSYLGANLKEICHALLKCESDNALIKNNYEPVDDNLVNKIKEDIESILNSEYSAGQ